MSRELKAIDTPLLIQIPTSGNDGLIESLSRSKRRLVQAAAHMIRVLAIDEADLDGEGAVDLAVVELLQTDSRDWYHAFEDDDEFFRLVYGAVQRVILQQERRSRAVKRGGAGRPGITRGLRQNAEAADHGSRRIEADLDQFASHEPPFEEVVAARLELEMLVEQLPDDLHRTFLIMHDQGFSTKEIARDLRLDRETVARKLKNVEQVYRKWKSRS